MDYGEILSHSHTRTFLAAFGNAKTRLNDNSSRFVSVYEARSGGDLLCSLPPLLHFRENTWRSPSTSRETPTVALSIAVSPPALSFHHRNRRYKFPIFLPFFSLSSSAPPPPSVLLEKVSGACFDRGDDLVEASHFTHCRLFQPNLLVPSLSFG